MSAVMVADVFPRRLVNRSVCDWYLRAALPRELQCVYLAMLRCSEERWHQ